MESPVAHSDAAQVGVFALGNAGVTLSEDELKANPKFVGLLGELFEQFFTPECCSKDSKEELEQAKGELKREKQRYTEERLVRLHLDDLLLEHRRGGQGMLTGQERTVAQRLTEQKAFELLDDAMTAKETVQSLAINTAVSSDVAYKGLDATGQNCLFGLSAEDVEAMIPSATLQSSPTSVGIIMHKLESRLQSQHDDLVAFYTPQVLRPDDDAESSSTPESAPLSTKTTRRAPRARSGTGSKENMRSGGKTRVGRRPPSNARNSAGSKKQPKPTKSPVTPNCDTKQNLPDQVSTDQARVEEYRLHLLRLQQQALGQLATYFQTVQETLVMMMQVMKRHKLGTQFKDDQIVKDHLREKCSTLAVRLNALKHEIVAETYTKTTVQALKKTKKLLDLAYREAVAEHQAATRKIAEYERVGLGFQELVDQYSNLLGEIKNKSWTLEQLREE